MSFKALRVLKVWLGREVVGVVGNANEARRAGVG